MTYFLCVKCDELCDVIETDVGGYEEFWGAKVWRAEYDTVSECCGAEVEELTKAQADQIEAAQYEKPALHAVDANKSENLLRDS
jgi:hypothetical protein